MEAVQTSPVSRLVPVAEGEWIGWSHDPIDPYEAVSGPFYTRRDPDGTLRCAFDVEKRHLNGGGFLHGGCLMTFADYAMFCIARGVMGGSPAVTATFNGEFLSSVHVGTRVECTGEVVKAGRSLVFFRGLITSAGETVMAFSAVIKKVSGGVRVVDG